MIKKQKTYKNLPLEVGKTYKTKICHTWTFTITDIQETPYRQIEGYYNDEKDWICTLREERIIPDTIEDGEIEVCGHCGTII